MPNAAWSSAHARLSDGFCSHPLAQKMDLVTGESTFTKAAFMRLSNTACGEDGMLYKQEKNRLVTALKGFPATNDILFVALYAFCVTIFVLRMIRAIP